MSFAIVQAGRMKNSHTFQTKMEGKTSEEKKSTEMDSIEQGRDREGDTAEESDCESVVSHLFFV
jgi:hypothetical protein